MGMVDGAGAAWAPTTATQLTRWGKQVTPDNAWRVYSRPQLVREKWQSLNGLWKLGIDGNATADEPVLDHEILVPYPVEASLSGVGKRATHLLYRRNFTVPADWKDQRVLLHFDACDWKTSVTVNGKLLKTLDGDEAHEGGYDRFSYDITDALKDGEQEVTVAVFDPTEKGDQPRGKQVTNPHGIWYTPTTGIWQPVWLEPVSAGAYVRGVKFNTEADTGKVSADVTLGGDAAGVTVEVTVDGEAEAKGSAPAGTAAELQVEQPKLWGPDSPTLYDAKVTVKRGDTVLDEVKSYFAFRTIEKRMVGKFQRLFLNGKEIFQLGPLDQGFWPDGLHTPPSAEALTWDVDYTRELGFNLIRKHIKVEPDLWYHYCDKTGMLVWQDAVNGVMKTEESHRQFERDMFRMIDNHWNSPAIVLWVVFNEGWGQYDTERLTKEVKQKDPARLVTNASGWHDKQCGDIIDVHKYPGPGAPDPDPTRASVLGEFGGLGLKVEGHTWSKDHWGYQGMDNADQLYDRFKGIMEGLKYLRAIHGLNAAIYTQTTDVEIEANGLVTYDREVKKMDTAKVKAINDSIVFLKDLRVVADTALATSGTKDAAPVWQYSTEKPSDDWAGVEFDAAKWTTGPAGFGDTTKRIFGPVNTEWTSEQIWARREVMVAEDVKPEDVLLNIAHVEKATVYINGVLAAELDSLVTGYTPVELKAEARAALKPGKVNVLAVHCVRPTKPEVVKNMGQYVDVGLIEQGR